VLLSYLFSSTLFLDRSGGSGFARNSRRTRPGQRTPGSPPYDECAPERLPERRQAVRDRRLAVAVGVHPRLHHVAVKDAELVDGADQLQGMSLCGVGGVRVAAGERGEAHADTVRADLVYHGGYHIGGEVAAAIFQAAAAAAIQTKRLGGVHSSNIQKPPELVDEEPVGSVDLHTVEACATNDIIIGIANFARLTTGIGDLPSAKVIKIFGKPLGTW